MEKGVSPKSKVKRRDMVGSIKYTGMENLQA